mgnify:CR=1 FL=1
MLLPGNYSLYRLHQVIQLAIGWTDSHLHQFVIEGRHYSLPSPDDYEPVIDERRHKLSQIALEEKYKFVYEYDFGDGWEHEILVEKILAPETGVKYPVCIKGKRACPPEDVGGAWGYEAFLQAINDPQHEEHASFIEWVGPDFDAEAFDLEEINQELKRMK